MFDGIASTVPAQSAICSVLTHLPSEPELCLILHFDACGSILIRQPYTRQRIHKEGHLIYQETYN